MKYLGLILAVVVALMASQVLARRINERDTEVELSRSRRALSSKFRNFVDVKARIIMRQGNSTLGIPVLDPFHNEKLELALNEKLVKGNIEVTDVDVTGLSGYKVDKAEVSMLTRKLTLGLTFPKIYSKGSYKVDAVVEKFEINGEGDYTAVVSNLSFVSNVWLGIIGGVSIKSMETSISLGGLELVATGLFNDEDTSKIISEAISDMAPQVLKDYQKEITATVNRMVMKYVNDYLAGKSLAELLAMFG